LIILVTNDDGIHSEGIRALAKALETVGDVYVMAPDRERSAAAHALTLHSPLRVEEIEPRWYSVDGTPTDCINIGVNGRMVLPQRPDIIVSGINKGGNLADDITYSGTVAGAIEGTLLGLPSIAVSLMGRQNYNWEPAAHFAARVVEKIAQHGMPADTLLNINVPNQSEESIRGVKITKMGKRVYGDSIIENVDPRGRKYYWIGGDELKHKSVEGSDIAAVIEGYISVTPLHLDLTNHGALDEMRDWSFEGWWETPR
jgi:5'-nucleotidase